MIKKVDLEGQLMLIYSTSEVNMKDAYKTLESYCNFSDPSAVYILLLLPRKKENKDQKENEKIKKRKRYIVSNMDDVKYALDEFDRYAKMHPEVVFRIYISVNRRSLMAGMINFQKRLLDFNMDLMRGNADVWVPIAKLGSDFKSVLSKKESRFDKNWLFDVDIPNDDPIGQEIIADFEEHLKSITKVLYSGRSRSGYAIVIKPCNPNAIEIPLGVELKKDAYLYVGILNEQEHR